MRSIVTDRVAWSVGLSDTLVSPAKTAKPIEMLFGFWVRTHPRNHVLDGGQIPMERGNFGGKGAQLGQSAITCAKTAEPIVMPFGLRLGLAKES